MRTSLTSLSISCVTTPTWQDTGSVWLLHSQLQDFHLKSTPMGAIVTYIVNSAATVQCPAGPGYFNTAEMANEVIPNFVTSRHVWELSLATAFAAHHLSPVVVLSKQKASCACKAGIPVNQSLAL